VPATDPDRLRSPDVGGASRFDHHHVGDSLDVTGSSGDSGRLRADGRLAGVYEHPAPGRRFGPTLIALLVVLASVAGTMSYLVARRVIITRAGGAGPAVTTDSPDRTGTPRGGGSGQPGPTGSATPSPADTGTVCPPITEKSVVDAGLAGGLKLLMYVHVHSASATDSESEAWVCQNKDGVLVYQGHVRNGPFTAALSDNTLLLAEGLRGYVVAEGDGYLAVNPGKSGLATRTEYHVSRTELVIIHQPSGAATHYPIISVYPSA
jgi:hypothetical protein